MVQKSSVVLFGSQSDPEIKKRTAKIKAGGRNVSVQSSSSYPDGTGPCGKVCSCTDVCKDSVISEIVVHLETPNQGVKSSKR